jgi:hypothetical protein
MSFIKWCIENNKSVTLRERDGFEPTCSLAELKASLAAEGFDVERSTEREALAAATRLWGLDLVAMTAGELETYDEWRRKHVYHVENSQLNHSESGDGFTVMLEWYWGTRENVTVFSEEEWEHYLVELEVYVDYYTKLVHSIETHETVGQMITSSRELNDWLGEQELKRVDEVMGIVHSYPEE